MDTKKRICKTHFMKMVTTDIIIKQMNERAAAEVGAIIRPIDADLLEVPGVEDEAYQTLKMSRMTQNYSNLWIEM